MCTNLWSFAASHFDCIWSSRINTPSLEVEISPPPESPESILEAPEIIEIVPNPKPLRKHSVSKEEYLDLFKEIKTWCQYNIQLAKD